MSFAEAVGELIETIGIAYLAEVKMTMEFIKSKGLLEELNEFCDSKENLQKHLKPLKKALKIIMKEEEG